MASNDLLNNNLYEVKARYIEGPPLVLGEGILYYQMNNNLDYVVPDHAYYLLFCITV